MRHCGVMHLPSPLRAAVGLIATAADEAKRLPDRAIELPMLAVSSALQASLRAQQRYARLTARGDDLLNWRTESDDPPPWATFDEPVPTDDPRAATLAALNGLGDDGATSRLFTELFGVSESAAAGEDRDEPAPVDLAPPSLTVVPEPDDDAGRPAASGGGKAGSARSRATGSSPTSTKSTATKASGTRSTATKSGAAKASKSTSSKSNHSAGGTAAVAKTAGAKTAAAKTGSAKSAGATKKSSARTASTASSGKTVNKPRHTAPSKFDDAGD